jgi:hypothetical protein
MYQYRYRLTLYNTTRFDEFLTYDFPHLPVQTDKIEVCEGCFFEVKNRVFQPRQEGKIVHVMLHGVIVNGDDKGQYTWEKLRERILDQQGGIRRSRERLVEYEEFTGFLIT